MNWTNSRLLLWAYQVAKKAYYPIAIGAAGFSTGLYVGVIMHNGINR